MTAENETYDGSDALMAAITGEPVPEEVRADAGFAARYRAAESEVALLREQLGIIGDALARPDAAPAVEPETAPTRTSPPRPRRTWLPFAFGALAVAVAGFLFVGMGWLVVQSSDDSKGASADSGSAKVQDRGAYGACSRLVLEGDVTRVEPVPGTGRERVTLHVTRYYKPESGRSQVTVLTDRSVAPRPGKGDHVLVALPRQGSTPDLWVTGERDIAGQRAAAERAAQEPSATSCP
ncbi:hypothetical protein [Streptomyces brasiliensis]|uniref:Uncharacterized protein n=1 Tax=Streptomyces brasiliensis TaxID=1954 RepID=A0A917L2H5_9ACTN|nr:hypothetical protein [Streptomyces brasiliensis]GGJ37272.1 hypothetical protein GCM10010121_055560 [Streptomyces brasiliensis]